MPKLKKVKPVSKASNETKKKIIKYTVCLIWGVIVMAVGMIILAFAYLKLESRPTVIYYLTYLAIALGAFTVGNLSFNKLKGRGIITGLVASIPFIVIALVTVILFTLGSTSASVLLIIPVSAIAGAVGGVFAANSKKH